MSGKAEPLLQLEHPAGERSHLHAVLEAGEGPRYFGTP